MADEPTKNEALIREVLGDQYLELKIERLVMEEDLSLGQSKVRVETMADPNGERLVVEGVGVGVVDALMRGLLSRFAQDYQSLESIEFAGFTVQADIDSKEIQAGSDAVGTVTLEVRNSENQVFEFSESSRSIVASAARAVTAAVEYFVNAEKAFVRLHEALKDAKSRNRPDLVASFTRKLAVVVKSTSYTEVIDAIRKESLS